MLEKISLKFDNRPKYVIIIIMFVFSIVLAVFGFLIFNPPPTIQFINIETVVDSTTPPGNRSFDEIITSGLIDCGRTNQSTIDCWQPNTNPRIGLPANDFIDLVSLNKHLCGIKTDNSVICWQTVTNQRILTPVTKTKLTAIVNSNNQICGLKMDKTAVCWSDNQNQTPPPMIEFSQIAINGQQGCGIRTDKSVLCWGAAIRNAPTDKNYKSIIATDDYFCTLTEQGVTTCWGNGYQYNTNNEKTKFKKIVGGSKHVCGLKTDLSIACWGNNSQQQTKAPDGAFIALAATKNHSCALSKDSRRVVCWGENYNKVANRQDKDKSKTNDSQTSDNSNLNSKNEQTEVQNPNQKEKDLKCPTSQICSNQSFQIPNEDRWSYQIDPINCQTPDQNLSQKILMRMPFINNINAIIQKTPTVDELKNDWQFCFLKITYENLGSGGHTFNSGCLMSLPGVTSLIDSDNNQHKAFNVDLVCTQALVEFQPNQKTTEVVEFLTKKGISFDQVVIKTQPITILND